MDHKIIRLSDSLTVERTYNLFNKLLDKDGLYEIELRRASNAISHPQFRQWFRVCNHCSLQLGRNEKVWDDGFKKELIGADVIFHKDNTYTVGHSKKKKSMHQFSTILQAQEAYAVSVLGVELDREYRP